MYLSTAEVQHHIYQESQLLQIPSFAPKFISTSLSDRSMPPTPAPLFNKSTASLSYTDQWSTLTKASVAS